MTGIAVFDLLDIGAKTGIAGPFLRPSEAIIDPRALTTLPGEVVAASGLDVLSHALESFTARPFPKRARLADPTKRPLSQGANPWSDVGCREALALSGAFLVRAVRDATDLEARAELMWAATLAGIAFGNAGVHLPHGMSYAVAGLVRDFVPPGYDTALAMVPHGMSVILSAPSVFRATASSSPRRHLEAARLLGGDVDGASEADAGEALARTIERIMRDVGRSPNGIGDVGYAASDLDALAERAFLQSCGSSTMRRCPWTPARSASSFATPCRIGERPTDGHEPEEPTLRLRPLRSRLDPLDGQRRLRARQQRHVLQLLRHGGEPSHLIAEGGLDIHTSPIIGLVVESKCTYRAPIAFPDRVTTGLRVDRLGNRAVTYGIGIFRNDDDDAAAEGHFVHVFVDRVTRASVAIPEPMRVALARLVTSRG